MAALIGKSVSLVTKKSEGRGSSVGIVKYWGKTAFQDGDWVGVELQEPVGRNDGSVNGIQYFDCKPGFGVFVRPDAVNILAESICNNLSISCADENKEGEGLDYWFETAVKSFTFNKPTQEWIELETGVASFSWNSNSSKVQVNLGSCVNHLICPNTKLTDSIISQQSWVFRAHRNESSGMKEVLCFQFPSAKSTKEFVEQLDEYRTPYKSENLKATKNQLSDSSSKTRVMRRRLTVSGSNPNLDGFVEGGRLEQQPNGPNSPKKLKTGEEGSWRSSHSHENAISVAAYSGISRKGLAPYNPDKQNQDSMIMMQLPFSDYTCGELLLCVFDGHGENGHHVSRAFSSRLPEILMESRDFADDAKTEQVLIDSLKMVENELIQNRALNTTLSGTTAVVTLVRGNKYFVANVGDSRVAKGKVASIDKNGKASHIAVDLSEDHKPDLPAEKTRIERTGGRVFAIKYDDGIDGPPRVWLSYTDMPGLAMSRSLCDTVGKEAGVISEAETFVHTLSPNEDSFIILATDGLWEFMSSQEVIDIVSKYVPSRDSKSALKELVAESARRWQQEEPVIDDTTIILAFLE